MAEGGAERERARRLGGRGWLGGVMVGLSPPVPCHGQCAWGLRVLGAREPAFSAAPVGVARWAGGLLSSSLGALMD